jgi:hypothetical protein
MFAALVLSWLNLQRVIKRAAIFVHRWLGVGLCLLFLVWFPSGIGMMYWDFPSVTAADRLDRSPALDPSNVHLSPMEAYAVLGASQAPAQVRLNTFDGRPVYRFRIGRSEALVYADTGARPAGVTKELMQRAAAAWTGQPASVATVASIDVDQWTVQETFRNLQPLWKYSWPNGEQAYVSETSGEVVQYTTTRSRIGAYLGPIPHWLYFTPLRRHSPQWSAVLIWLSGIGTATAILGLIVGVWMYSPSKRYRTDGVSTSIPYRGQKRWHMALGLIFGLGAVTWGFSGMLSMDPFPLTRPGGSTGGRGEGNGGGIAQALRGRPQLAGFSGKHPREALGELADRHVKELELTSFADQPVYVATLGGGETRVLPVDGPARDGFDPQRIVDIAKAAAVPTALADVRVIDQYDSYYLDRRRRQPLPVILIRLNDSDHTRYYVDPRTAHVAGSYSARNWMNRWLYHGLHSLDFPWLYNYRPAWDIIVIAFMLGGTALCVTSLILAWGVLGRTLRSA